MLCEGLPTSAPFERVEILPTIANGQRFATYVIHGEPRRHLPERGPRPARLVHKGDLIIIRQLR